MIDYVLDVVLDFGGYPRRAARAGTIVYKSEDFGYRLHALNVCQNIRPLGRYDCRAISGKTYAGQCTLENFAIRELS